MSELDPRVAETVDHVQRAALELIAAMRVALDVAEDFAKDPSAMQALIGQASDFWRASSAGGGWPGQKSGEAAGGSEKVEHIDLD